MSNNKVRVRFAPSPTGYLHIGGARTALFNWLFARHFSGTFILRIEDTDRSRSTEDYIEAIIDGMIWLGLDWDEGPFRQTDRVDVYRGYIQRLMDEGKAYRCYCTPEELEERRQEAVKAGKTPLYDGKCRERREPVYGVSPVVRFRMPDAGTTIVEDLIRGNVTYNNSMFDDFIIMRSDGTPTYNFVVVADDLDMKVSHVIRGDDHLNNTPKQIHIYNALGSTPPYFAHLPMILGPDRTRLSKRHGATSVQAYRDVGYLPDALLNYLVRLGWSYGDQEVFSREELIKKFTLDNIGKAAAVFNPEKLLWLNAQYMKNTPVERLCELVIPYLLKSGIIKEDRAVDRKWLSRAIDTLRERTKTLVELSDSLRYYIEEDVSYNEDAAGKFLTEKHLPYLIELRDALVHCTEFSAREVERLFRTIIENHGIKLRDLAQPVRVSLTGRTESPGIFEVIEVLGRDRTVSRLEKAIGKIKD